MTPAHCPGANLVSPRNAIFPCLVPPTQTGSPKEKSSATSGAAADAPGVEPREEGPFRLRPLAAPEADGLGRWLMAHQYRLCHWVLECPTPVRHDWGVLAPIWAPPMSPTPFWAVCKMQPDSSLFRPRTSLTHFLSAMLPRKWGTQGWAGEEWAAQRASGSPLLAGLGIVAGKCPEGSGRRRGPLAFSEECAARGRWTLGTVKVPSLEMGPKKLCHPFLDQCPSKMFSYLPSSLPTRPRSPRFLLPFSA